MYNVGMRIIDLQYGNTLFTQKTLYAVLVDSQNNKIIAGTFERIQQEILGKDYRDKITNWDEVADQLFELHG